MIQVNQSGDFTKTLKFLSNCKKVSDVDIKKYAEKGLQQLKNNTPVRTGLTASSWSYEIKKREGLTTVEYHNANIQNGVSVAVLLQYGHATRSGSYIAGINYINPSLDPMAKELIEEVWKEVVQ